MDVENSTLIWIVLGGCALLVLLCLAGQFNIWKLGFDTNQFRFFEHFLSCNKKQDMLNFLYQIIQVGHGHQQSRTYGHIMCQLQASAVAVAAAFKGFAQGLLLLKPKLWRQKPAANIREQGATIS